MRSGAMNNRTIWLVCMIFVTFWFVSAQILHPQTLSDQQELPTQGKEAPAAVQQKLQELREEIAAKGYTFTVDYNPAMEYPPEQLCGLVVPTNWQDYAPMMELPPALTALPKSFDWRPNGVTPIRNQGDCGSCWAFGTVAPLESAIKIHCGETVDLSEQYLVSCNIDGDGCNGGWFAHDYHWWKKPPSESQAGAVLEGSFPYQAWDVACGGPYSHPYKIDGWYSLAYGIPSVDAIKQAIYSYGPVAAAVAVGSGFSYYSGGVFNMDESYAGINHAIALVGWNDDYYGNGTNVGVWILRNSWGTWWGDNGYMYIKYGTSKVGYAANFVVFSHCPNPFISGAAFGPDFDANKLADITVWNPYGGQWAGKDLQTNLEFQRNWGTSGDFPFSGDFDGDGKTDPGVWRPSTGRWHILLSGQNYTKALDIQWGINGDIPVPADFNGDKVTDLAVWRPSKGTWWVRTVARVSLPSVQWGIYGDVPVPADFNGDGKADLGIWRPSTGAWYARTIAGTYLPTVRWGAGGDVPMAADFNGDGAADLGIWRPSNGYWYIRNIAGTYSKTVKLGLNGDIPVVSDFDGDAKAEVSVWRPVTAQWFMLTSKSNYTQQQWYYWGAYGGLPLGGSAMASVKNYLNNMAYY